MIAENLATQDATGSTPGADPIPAQDRDVREPARQATWRRRGARQPIGRDATEFPQRYDPSNPAANADGYVKLPNVISIVEVMDMREAERSYSANLAVMQATRSMLSRTIDLLK